MSLLPKVEDMKQLISNTRPSVVAVTETWLDGSIEKKLIFRVITSSDETETAMVEVYAFT